MRCPICSEEHPVASNPSGQLTIVCKGSTLIVGENGEYFDPRQRMVEELAVAIDRLIEEADYPED